LKKAALVGRSGVEYRTSPGVVMTFEPAVDHLIEEERGQQSATAHLGRNPAIQCRASSDCRSVLEEVDTEASVLASRDGS
jgi:hypothetical protein